MSNNNPSKNEILGKPRKTSRIAIRIEPELYDVLMGLSNEASMKISQYVRCILIRFHMEYLIGQVKQPYAELKKEFLEMAKKIEKDKIILPSPRPAGMTKRK
jgi:hypothetical protein